MTSTTARTVVSFPARSRPASAPAAASPLARLRALWEAHLDESRRARATSLFADIDLHTLRDIGAPDWMIADASSRRRAHDRTLRDLEWS